MGNKYSTFLTVVLVILIIVILAIVAVIGIKTYKNYTEEKEVSKQIAELEARPNTNSTENNSVKDEGNNVLTAPIVENIITDDTTSSTGSRPKLKKYKTYPMIGYIKIKKIGIEYPILVDTSPGALETSVCIMYPLNATLNQKGNVVIIGHNYRNGKFFSDNKKLATGDKIEITDLKGVTLTYTIYEIFETTPNDTEYITRERGENIEISLSTCTDDGKGRLVILAKVE